MSQVIPEAAVEAAAEAIVVMRQNGQENTQQEYARAALEAAAPHMLAEAWDQGQDAGADDQMAVDASLANGTPEPVQTANPYRPAK